MLLEKILEAKKAEIAKSKNKQVPAEASEQNFPHKIIGLKEVLDRRGFSAIAEIKRASPSAGSIRGHLDVEATALNYRNAGAAGISVLTCGPFFNGTAEDLRVVRKAVDVPVLMKDFIFDRDQVLEARIYGADAVLLIMRILDDGAFLELAGLADSLQLQTLVEVHNKQELQRALSLVACWDNKILGINNRNLETLNIDLSTTADLMKTLSGYKITVISESGIRCREDVVKMKQLGVKGILVGETLLKKGDPGQNLKELLKG